ncbi:hypothetical protein VDG1235_2205 [Verrucomicrobiia bacterium DG1235]|nr:hypothetical protein VDG1235_2205 [Verrucomicrobiae bacterium DG1235]
MIVLDTHALLWWTLDPSQLSRKAKSTCSPIEEQGAYISSISIWELGVKIRNKKLDIGMSIREYAEKIRRLGSIEIVPVTESIWIRNLELEWDHRDPADRTIVATALTLDLPILSKDKIIRTFKGVKSIW